MAEPNDPLFPPKPEEQAQQQTEPPVSEPEDEGVEGEAEEGEEPGAEEDVASVEPEQSTAPADVATVHRIREEEDFPQLIQRVFAERGSKATGESYSGHLRRFITWVVSKGLDTKTMPPDTAEKYLEEAYANPVTRAQANVALRSCFDVGQQFGITFARQEIAKPHRPRRPKASPPAEQPAPPEGSALHRLATEGPAPQQRAVAQPAPTPQVGQQIPEPPRVSQQRATPGIPKSRTGVPPLGGRIRISKRSDGTDGYPPGTPILVGMYDSTVLEGEGSIEEFIANRIRPTYGPRHGERATTYYVDRLDNLGNPIPNSTLSIPVLPGPTDPGAGPPQQNQQPQYPYPQPQPVNQGGPTFDMFVQYLMRRQEEAEKKYENLMQQMQGQAKQGGMDPMMFTLLAERMRPEPLDVAKAAEEWKRANPDQQVKWGRRKTDREGGDGMEGLFGGPQRPAQTQGLAGLEFEREQRERDRHESMLAEAIRQQGEMLRALIVDRGQQQQTAQQNPRDLFEMFATFAKAIQPQERSDPLRDKLAEMALMNASKAPEPAKGVKELIAEIRELREVQDILGGGEEKPLGFGDIMMAAVEHAPQIGEALGNILSSLPRAPVLPRPVPVPVAGRRVNGANGTQQPARKPTPIPKEAQTAFLALRDEVDEQQVVNRLFEILMAYKAVNAEPWPQMADLVVKEFQKATTRDEVRVVVTNLFVWSGAKKLMSPQVVDRITDVLAKHYSIIYAQLTGGEQKNLSDVAQSVPPTPDTAPPRPEVLEHRPPPAQAAQQPAEGEEAVYEEESGPTMTMPIGGYGNPSGAGQPPGLFGP